MMSRTSVYAERRCIEESPLGEPLNASSVKLCLFGGQLLLSLLQRLLPLLEQGHGLSNLELWTTFRLQAANNVTLQSEIILNILPSNVY